MYFVWWCCFRTIVKKALGSFSFGSDAFTTDPVRGQIASGAIENNRQAFKHVFYLQAKCQHSGFFCVFLTEKFVQRLQVCL